MKYILLLIAAVGMGAHAGEVTTPHTFTNGTPADADQVNANFQAHETEIDDNAQQIANMQPALAVKSNGTIVGYIVNTQSGYPIIITTKGYLLLGNSDYITDLYIEDPNMELYYDNASCTGQAYVREVDVGNSGTYWAFLSKDFPILSISKDIVIYTEKDPIQVTISHKMHHGTDACTALAGGEITARRAYPNDFATTGITPVYVQDDQFEIENHTIEMLGLP